MEYVYVHYGHDDGSQPVCYGRGKADWTLPHGEGMRYYMKWCKECQRILQSLHGPNSFQNIQLDLPGIES
jgi:hypothetical protein